MRVALFNKSFQEKDLPVLKYTIGLLNEHQMELIIFKDFYEQIKSEISFTQAPKLFAKPRDLPPNTSFFLSFGGDGTMLEAVCFVQDSGIPIMGINLGRLGFLAAIPKDEVGAAIRGLTTGAYNIEDRTLIHLDSSTPMFSETPFALNEFTIHRKDTSAMVKIHTFLNGAFLNTYWCDGLIVSTPTGSTGYSLSCNGPLIFPQSSSFVITPVAPHNLNIRSLVIPDTSIVSFEVEGRAEQFLATLDSRMESFDTNIQLAVRKEQFTIKLVRPNSHTFLNTIRQKLYWGVDSRN